jgi:hypothetical protein
MNIASLILRPDLGFFALRAFQSFKRPVLSFGSSSRISLRRQSFSVSRPRLRPPGNIHNRSRLLLTNKIRPCFVAMSFDDFAITVPHRLTTNSSVWFYMMFLEKNRVSALLCRGYTRGNHNHPAVDVRGGRVEDGRGSLRPMANAPFPIPAHQTGRADFRHPAFRLASPQGTRRQTNRTRLRHGS